MTVTKGQKISTGAAIRHAMGEGIALKDIEKASIDGKDVDAIDAEAEFGILQEAVEEAERLAKANAERKAEQPQGSSVFSRAWQWTGNTINDVASWTNENVAKPVGDWADENIAAGTTQVTKDAVKLTTDAAMSNPEDVARDAIVKLTLRGGRTLEIPVKVRDELATSILRYTSATAGGLGLVPIVGNLVQGGTGLAAGLASGASYLFGDKELGRAFFGMAKKHLVLGLVGFVPVASAATAGAAIKDIGRVNEGVRVDEIVMRPVQDNAGP